MMKKSSRKEFQSFSKVPHQNRRGAVLVLAAILMVPLFAFLAFSVDIGYMSSEKAKLQAAADASALASVNGLPEQSSLDSIAQQYATLNYPAAGGSLQVTAEAGTWDSDARTFSPANPSSANAVRVTVTRQNLNLFFAPIIGQSQTNLTAQAIAIKGNSDCFDGGIVAKDRVIMGQDVRLSNYCVYGRNGVSMGQDPHVTNGAKVGSLDESTIEYGQDPVGLPENIVEADKQPTLADNVMQIIDDLKNGVNLPPQITRVEYFPSATHLPNNLTPGTVYVFDESISIDQDYHVSDVIIATRKNISWGQDGKIRNSGDPSGDSYAIGLYAGESISLGQDAQADGVNIAGGKDVTIGQDIRGFSGTIQSAQKVIVGQDPHLSGSWKDAMPNSVSGSAGSSSRLVQ